MLEYCHQYDGSFLFAQLDAACSTCERLGWHLGLGGRIGGTTMEQHSHTFVLRIWNEPREIEGAVPEWRGLIEHVSDGQSCYFRDLDQVIAFVRRYLEES
jgi:hypothetical protein